MVLQTVAVITYMNKNKKKVILANFEDLIYLISEAVGKENI